MAVTENKAARQSARTVGGAEPGMLLTMPECPPAVGAAYDTLLANVDLALGINAGGMVAVAAIDANADASLVAANLAVVAALGGDRTLLVDADLQAAGVTGLFDLATMPGLAQLLGGEHPDLRTLTQPTTLPTLGVITTGASGARHGRLARYGDIAATLLRLKNAADRVIIATPPVLTGPDLLRITPYIDGVLLVVSAGRTERTAARQARDLLAKAEAPVLGVVLQ